MKDNELRGRLECIGAVKHLINIIHDNEAVVMFDLLDDNTINIVEEEPDGYRWGTYYNNKKKRIRKLYSVYMTEGIVGLYELIEKENSKLRKLLWDYLE